MSYHIGKALEAAVRRLRPWLRPSYRRSYRALVARGMREHRDGEPVVCCNFGNQAIDAVGGRYYFSLVRDLIDAGYFPVFTARRSTLASFGISRMKSSLLTERLGVIRTLDELRQPYFLITDGDASASPLAERVVKVDYDWRLCRQPDEIAFPVFVHPWITTMIKLPYIYQADAVRPARIFFGGNTSEGKYDKDVLRDRYAMLTRREMLEIAGAELPAADIHRPRDAADWLASEDAHPFVLCETQHCKIPGERWLDALAKADFFLACPGVGMPLCHNLIEALAAGAIPILQYADYLPEPLEDGVNCLAFADPAGLAAAIRRAVAMTPEDILRLRVNVRHYYDAYLAPGRFARSLFTGATRKTLLMNAYRVPRGGVISNQ